uniref:PX domain-containing protein n=1 Tax=Caenorhabditis tropicalis TaxID=1561998 RepID=A0A1I7TH12_9PELO
MRRDEAQQLLEDKLLFLGDSTLENVHLRRFCLVVTSDETFQLDDGSNIPAETITISMDNGKISSILRFFPSKTRSFKMESVEEFQGHRMRRVYWNPSVVKDSNLMFRTWCHFLERCLLSLLLVPLNKLQSLLDFLRKINEIRTIQNNRPTVSICLSRVICVEDYLSAIQNVINTHVVC